jgi:3-oxoacyl-[acyl-carrier-protein] synthase II
MRLHEVVVTACGIVSPLGIGMPEFRRRMFAGDSGGVDIRGTLVADTFPVKVAALVPRERLGQPSLLAGRPPETTPLAWRFSGRPPEATPLAWRFAGTATEEALERLPPGHEIDAIVYAAAEWTNFDLIRESFREFDADRFDWNATRAETTLELLRAMVAAHGNGHVLDQQVIALNNACISSNQAIGIALHRVRAGEWRRVLVGGVDARCKPDNLMNFQMLGALTTADVPPGEASRPFSKDRSGFVRGEGAATLILESREAAEERGAEVLGVVAGYAATSDAYRLTDGRPDVKGAVRAMRNAIADAGIPKERVSAISAHGTSTAMNDSLETRAIKELFGNQAARIPVTALKSQVGHSTVAAGALEAVSCLVMLQDQRLAPTINYHEPDPDCDLDYVPCHAREAQLDAILSNNFGFGGQNGCVVFRRSDA